MQSTKKKPRKRPGQEWKGRYWAVRTEDGTDLVVESNVAPRFAVRYTWETSQLRQSGGSIPGLGAILEADPSKPQVEQTGYLFYERRADAKAAAENSAPHIAAVPTLRDRRSLSRSPLEKRKVVRLEMVVELDREDYRRLRKRLQQKVRRDLMIEQTFSFYGIGTKKRVAANVLRDEHFKARGLDAQERKARWIF